MAPENVVGKCVGATGGFVKNLVVGVVGAGVDVAGAVVGVVAVVGAGGAVIAVVAVVSFCGFTSVAAAGSCC